MRAYRTRSDGRQTASNDPGRWKVDDEANPKALTDLGITEATAPEAR